MSPWLTELQNDIMVHHQEWISSVLFITIASFFTWIVWRVLHSRLSILVEKIPFHWVDLLLEALTPHQHANLVLACNRLVGHRFAQRTRQSIQLAKHESERAWRELEKAKES
jgi:hypothetical protein